MLKIVISSFIALSMLISPVFAVNPTPPPASAVVDPCSNPDVADSELCRTAASGGALFGPDSIWTNILNVLVFAVGAIAVLMIILGAIKYAVSGGDQAQVTSAKNTIIYAVVALVIAVMAGAIVNFVLTNI